MIRKYRHLSDKNKISKFQQVGKMSTDSNIFHTSVLASALLCRFVAYISTAGFKQPLFLTAYHAAGSASELSMGWVDPWVGLGQVGSRFFSFWWVWFGWVHYSKSTKNLKGLF